MMDSELFMKDQLWVSKAEASVLLNVFTLMRKIVFAFYDKAAESHKKNTVQNWNIWEMRQGPSCNIVSNIEICIFFRKANWFGILKRQRNKNPLNVSSSICNLLFTHLLPCIYRLHMFFRIFSSGIFEFSTLECLENVRKQNTHGYLHKGLNFHLHFYVNE